MKMKQIILSILTVMIVLCMVGCKPYNKPEFVTITPSQTAFLVPLVGDTTDQSVFESEEALNSLKVATKEVQIPKREVKIGRFFTDVEYRPSATLILVERKPETREWTASKATGTSINNQGIMAESEESIGFTTSMNVSAQINEEDAAKFLYRYNNKTLASIMDTEIRAMIEGKFVEECAKRTLEEIQVEKEEIMKVVSDDVIPYFAERGISITVLALKGTLVYENPEIQTSIDNEFKAAQELKTQADINAKNLTQAETTAKADKIEAEAKAEVLMIEANAIAEANQVISASITDAVLKNKYYETWDGKLPATVVGEDANMMFQIP